MFASERDGPILPGKARTSHDWYGKNIGNGFVQWEMDTFILKNGCTSWPSWNIERNPYNHPSQLNERERKANRRLLEWRKGFEPYETS